MVLPLSSLLASITGPATLSPRAPLSKVFEWINNTLFIEKRLCNITQYIGTLMHIFPLLTA